MDTIMVAGKPIANKKGAGNYELRTADKAPIMAEEAVFMPQMPQRRSCDG
jgi:hypothetical protein